MIEAADPIVNSLNRPFWDGAAQGVLVLPYCVASDRPFWPPAPFSPLTGGATAWRAIDPVASIEGLVVYRRAFQAAFADRLPYGVALVSLVGDVRLHAHVEAPDCIGAPRVGDRVWLAFRPGPGAAPLLVAERLDP